MSPKVPKGSTRMGFRQAGGKRKVGHLQIQSYTRAEKDAITRAFNKVMCFICLERPGKRRTSGRYVCSRCNHMWWHEDEV